MTERQVEGQVEEYVPEGAPPPLVVGVDVGGTTTSAAAVAADGSLGPVITLPTRAGDGPDAVLDTVQAVVRDVVAASGRPLAGVGIGTAGVVDAHGAVLSATATFAGWAGTDVHMGVLQRVATLAGRGAPPVVHVENDVDAHAAGEVWCGAARGASSALLVAVGTGIGGALVLDGRTWRGAHHAAGEIGHVPAPGAELLRCTCGRDGHLEAVAAGPAVHRRYLALGGEPTSPDARDVVARAADGDTVAERVVVDAAAAVGRAVAGLVNVLDPEVVVVGGGMAGAGDLWWTALDAAVRTETLDALRDVPVRPAALGTTAPLVGAARGAWGLLAARPATPALPDRDSSA